MLWVGFFIVYVLGKLTSAHLIKNGRAFFVYQNVPWKFDTVPSFSWVREIFQKIVRLKHHKNAAELLLSFLGILRILIIVPDFLFPSVHLGDVSLFCTLSNS